MHVFNPYAAYSRNVDTRLHGVYHIFFEDRRSARVQNGKLVNEPSHSMPGAVVVILAIPMARNDIPRNRVNRERIGARNCRNSRTFLRMLNYIIYFFSELINH